MESRICLVFGCMSAHLLPKMRRIFAAVADRRDKVSLPGIDADSIHKYALDILLDFQVSGAVAAARTRRTYGPGALQAAIPRW